MPDTQRVENSPLPRPDETTDIPAGLARALVAHSRDGISIVDADGTLRFASPWAERMLGYEPGETIGRNVFELVHPDDQVGALEGFESTVSSADSRPLPTLVRLKRADGSWLQAEIIGTNYLDDENIRGLLLNVRDVGRSMRTEAALRESEEHHRLIVELAREGVWTVDADGRTTFANRAMAEMLDCTVAEMHEASMFDFMDDESRVEASPQLDRRDAGIAEEHDVRLTTKRGRTVWARMNTSPITDHRGTYRGAIALVTDITERRGARAAARGRRPAGLAHRSGEPHCAVRVTRREVRQRPPGCRALHRSRRLQGGQRRRSVTRWATRCCERARLVCAVRFARVTSWLAWVATSSWS